MDMVLPGGIVTALLFFAACKASGAGAWAFWLFPAWPGFFLLLGLVRTTITASREDNAITVTRQFFGWNSRKVFPLPEIKRVYSRKLSYSGGLGREILIVELLNGRKRSLATWASWDPVASYVKILQQFVPAIPQAHHKRHH